MTVTRQNAPDSPVTRTGAKVRLVSSEPSGEPLASMTIGSPLEILAMLRTPAVKDSVVDALTGIENVGVRAGHGEFARLNLQTVVDTETEILLLDVDLNDSRELKQLEELKRILPSGRSIIVTSEVPSVEGMRSLMRLGIADFVPQPIQRVDLLRAITAAIDHKPHIAASPPSDEARVVCFFSACGGMGATTLAVQSACALGAESLRVRKNGKPDRGENKNDKTNVCILDLDIQLGSAGLYLDLPSKSSVLDLHAAIGRVDGSMLRTAMAHHRCGVDVLTAPAHVQPLEDLTPEGIMRLLLIARREYREIMVDLPPVWTRWTRALIRGSDVLVLILQPSVPAVRQAKRQLDTLIEEGLEDVPVAFVMNRVEQTGIFRRPMNEVTLKDAATALGREIAYTVPNDYASMIQAINQGLPLFEVNGAQAVAKRIAENIDNILAQVSAQKAHTALA